MSTSERNDNVIGVLAEFGDQHQLLRAARSLRRQGFNGLEAFSPFPIHGMDDALGIKPSRLPWLALSAGILGGVVAMGGQWWTNTIDYAYIVSGKPLFSLPANVPVAFEVVILAAAFAVFFGMLAFNRLPRLANPLFRCPTFTRASDDGFFLYVSADSSRESTERAVVSLQGEGGTNAEIIKQDTSQSRIPRGFVYAGAVIASLAVLPPLMIASARATTSDRPRLHTFFDMDFQPKLKSQTESSLFADGRSMRPRIEGTVRRGGLRSEIDTGLATDGIAGQEMIGQESRWKTEIPLPITDDLMRRGRERFNIHCAVCHGKAGYGNGLASLRAIELQQGTWVPPTSIHSDYLLAQPVGELFNSITHGIRKMPAYGHQINAEDRWAIVLYVKALQRSQHASLDDVPDSLQETLRSVE